jgi:hypothetical protein
LSNLTEKLQIDVDIFQIKKVDLPTLLFLFFLCFLNF